MYGFIGVCIFFIVFTLLMFTYVNNSKWLEDLLDVEFAYPILSIILVIISIFLISFIIGYTWIICIPLFILGTIIFKLKNKNER